VAISAGYKTVAESLVVTCSQPGAPALDLCNRIGLNSPVDSELKQKPVLRIVILIPKTCFYTKKYIL
jgi:hypothetical protein